MSRLEYCQFQTERLRVSPWRDTLTTDGGRRWLVSELLPLLSPRVTATLPEPLQLAVGDEDSVTAETLSAWIDARDNEGTILTVRDRMSGEEEQERNGSLMGLMILSPPEEEGVEEPGGVIVHIGYLFREDYWGKGLATELVRGFVGWCRSAATKLEVDNNNSNHPQPPLLVTTILAGVEPHNGASAAVLRKNGFQRSDELSLKESDVYCLGLK